ncbi:MAG: NRDE family protein [Cyclobacteriaceae bacterium]|nr:NRDE family protein [Cyclobacteriaceae bacterium]
MHYYSNITNNRAIVSEGVHGLSNAFLDTSWPKVNHGISMLSQTIDESNFQLEDIIAIMSDKIIAPKDSLPKTGISLELERKLSPVFISMKGYGTRCSTAIRLDYDNNLEFLEVSYDESAHPTSTKRYELQLNSHK